MKKLLTTLGLAMGLCGAASAQYESPLIALSGFGAQMYVVDTSDFSVYSTTNVTPDGAQTIAGFTGMAVKSDGTILAIVNGNGYPTRSLVSINPNTAVATLIGETGANVVSMTLIDDNTLVGITGPTGGILSSLVQIDMTTGAASVLAGLPDVFGASICYSPDDDLIYYWKADSFKTISPVAPYTITNIPTSGYIPTNYIFSAQYIGNNTFLAYDGDILWYNTSGLIIKKTSDGNNFYRSMALYPHYTTSTTDALSFCEGDSATLTATALGASYQWTRDGNDIAGEIFPTYTATESGAYNCKISIAGLVNTAMTDLEVVENPFPVVDFTVAADTLCNSDVDFTLTGGSPAGGVYSGDAVTAGMFSPSAVSQFENMVVYTYTDANGCTSADTATFYVDICGGTNTLANTTEISVYPNPSTVAVNIAANLAMETVEIHSLLGQQIAAFAANNQTLLTIPTANLPKGTYLLRIQMQNGELGYRYISVQ